MESSLCVSKPLLKLVAKNITTLAGSLNSLPGFEAIGLGLVNFGLSVEVTPGKPKGIGRRDLSEL